MPVPGLSRKKLLSRRLLHFSDDYVYFQCQAKTLSETDGDLPAAETSGEASIFNTQFIHKYSYTCEASGQPREMGFRGIQVTGGIIYETETVLPH